MSILGFEKEEFRVVSFIFAVLLIFMLFNFRVALRRQRDSQRKQDVRDILNQTSDFQIEFGYIPDTDKNFSRVPKDPDKKRDYYYIKDEHGVVSVYASLEGKDEAEYDPKVESLQLPCGSFTCNFVLSNKFINTN